MSKGSTEQKHPRQEKNFQAGVDAAKKLPGFRAALERCALHFDNSYPMAKEDWGYVLSSGEIYCNPIKDAEPKEWQFILAYLCCHLVMGHFRDEYLEDPLWHVACNYSAAKYLTDAKIGSNPLGFEISDSLRFVDEEQLFLWLKENPANVQNIPTITAMHSGRPDMVKYTGRWYYRKTEYETLFAEDLQWSIRQAMRQTAGLPEEEKGYCRYWDTEPVVLQARDWFLSSFPLLGAIAANFRIVTDRTTVGRMQIPIAAVSAAMQEIYINTAVHLKQEEWVFVLAHEFLHAALRHDARCDGREPELWNVACDFVINQWLHDMGVGQMPDGLLYDEQFNGLSAEQVYDELLKDLRYYRGLDPSDIIFENSSGYCTAGDALDDYYRRAIARGLEYHQLNARGSLPLGLIEEIHALSQRPIPWDVQLAIWFDELFAPLEPRHSYARLSRRQTATPDIPRPAWITPEEQTENRIFAVLLDTSGSMDRHLLAQALGAISSYAESRQVRHIRVVFCDAHTYDQGIMSPEDLAGAVRVQGRGGTVLQPGIDLLDNDKSFPRDAPLLIITDGACDHLNLHGRTHAYLLPKGNNLPFSSKGKVFRIQ